MKTKMVLIALSFMATLGLSAQTPKTQKTAKQKSCYVDTNNNNVCDKYENGTCTVGNGKGLALRDGSGRKNGRGNGKGKGQGLRDGSGRANGGKGANYVDKNNNGVCDNRENSKN